MAARFVLKKDTGALIDEQSYNAGPQIGDLLVGVAHQAHHLLHVRQLLGLKEIQQEADRLLLREDMQFMRVLDIHDLITDIIGCLDQVNQWIACETFRMGGIRLDAQLMDDAMKTGFLRLEEAELTFLAGVNRGVRIFND